MKIFKKISIISVPIVIIVGASLTYFAVSKKSDSQIDSINQDTIIIDQETKPEIRDIYQDVKIFPEIDNYQFYSLIRMIDGSKQPIINNDMVLYMAKYIINNMNVSGGEISWGMKRKSSSEVDIQISWKHEYEEKEFTYNR